MPTSLSFLVKRRTGSHAVSLRILLLRYAANVLLYSSLCSYSRAYTIVEVSTGAPAGIETQFIAAIQGQFNVKVVPNPLASNTYAVTLYGLNQNYNPPVTQADLLKALDNAGNYMATVDSYTYVYGFADGQSYNQHVTNNFVEGFEINCSTPIVGVSAWDAQTCGAVAEAIDDAIFEESLSTPTIVPGGF